MHFSDFFDIDGTIDFIKYHSFRKIALQIPDELLHYGPRLSSSLSSLLNEFGRGESSSPKVAFFVAVLGDSSFGSCCVDAVAAAHMNADCLIHYGHACMSAPSKLPVYHVFPGKPTSAAFPIEIAKSLLSHISWTDEGLLLAKNLFARNIAAAETLISSSASAASAAAAGVGIKTEEGEAMGHSSSSTHPEERRNILLLWEPSFSACISSALSIVAASLKRECDASSVPVGCVEVRGPRDPPEDEKNAAASSHIEWRRVQWDALPSPHPNLVVPWFYGGNRGADEEAKKETTESGCTCGVPSQSVAAAAALKEDQALKNKLAQGSDASEGEGLAQFCGLHYKRHASGSNLPQHLVTDAAPTCEVQPLLSTRILHIGSKKNAELRQRLLLATFPGASGIFCVTLDDLAQLEEVDSTAFTDADTVTAATNTAAAAAAAAAVTNTTAAVSSVVVTSTGNSVVATTATATGNASTTTVAATTMNLTMPSATSSSKSSLEDLEESASKKEAPLSKASESATVGVSVQTAGGPLPTLIIAAPWSPSIHEEELSARTSQRLMAASMARIESLRKASLIGIVAGTLGVSRHREVIATLRTAAKRASKHAYTLLVGKLNATKLGNFPEVEAFILVACPETSLFGAEVARDYGGRVLATPQEALIAFTAPSREDADNDEGEDGTMIATEGEAGSAGRKCIPWLGRAELSFAALLDSAAKVGLGPSAAAATGKYSHLPRGGNNGEAKDYDISGAKDDVLGDGFYTPSESLGGGDASALVATNSSGGSGTALSKGLFFSPAAAYASSSRTWRGLEYDASSRLVSPGESATVSASNSSASSASAADGSAPSTVSTLAISEGQKQDARVWDVSISEGLSGVASGYKSESTIAR